MKTDAEVQIMLRERHKGKTQAQAAARAGMHPNTARNYQQRGALPSQLKQPRTYRTRSDPFADDWPWVQAHLERDSAVQAQTLFALLCDQHPGRYQVGQLRTLQRRIALWRAQHGPDREVMFAQIHHPGQRAQSDFTDTTDLNITLAGQPFPHLLYHPGWQHLFTAPTFAVQANEPDLAGPARWPASAGDAGRESARMAAR
jgi:hypothetical protein